MALARGYAMVRHRLALVFSEPVLKILVIIIKLPH